MAAWNVITQHCPRKEAALMPLALKTMRTVFWDAEGCI
jgi:hypothetical protein